MTPTDEMAFFGPPPLFRPEDPDIPVRISCVYTWDITKAEWLRRQWEPFYKDVQAGGPAYGDSGGEFVPGRFVRDGVVVTSRGCSKDCSFCLVPGREGWIRELPIRDGYNVIDNNLLACSRGHVEAVFEMLSRQTKAAIFSGGLDAELFQEWHGDLVRKIRVDELWFACDHWGAVSNIEKVAGILSDMSIEKKRCYVLIGYNGESIRQAEKRLGTVFGLGFLPFAMLYQGEDESGKYMSHTMEWKQLQKEWCRPAIYRSRAKRVCEGA
jgi:hypothetical protein